METITFKTRTVQEILNYLSIRPYNEVFQLIAIMQQEIQNQPTKEKQSNE